jgi:hypothetical protein
MFYSQASSVRLRARRLASLANCRSDGQSVVVPTDSLNSECIEAWAMARSAEWAA